MKPEKVVAFHDIYESVRSEILQYRNPLRIDFMREGRTREYPQYGKNVTFLLFLFVEITFTMFILFLPYDFIPIKIELPFTMDENSGAGAVCRLDESSLLGYSGFFTGNSLSQGNPDPFI